MTTFAERMKYAMGEARMNQADLSLKTGIGRPSISQYLSGKNEPKREKVDRLAEALECSSDFLLGYDVPATINIFPVDKVTTRAAANCLRKSEQFIREGLKRGILPFGNAVPGTGRKYIYYISPTQFRNYVGADRFDQFFGA